MIIDYLNDKQFAVENGASEESRTGDIYFKTDEVCKEITFRNFVTLHLSDTLFENCNFENCLEICIDGSDMRNCNFNNVNCVAGAETDFIGCTFKNCCSDNTVLSINDKGRVEDCIFDTITTLGIDSYIVNAVYEDEYCVQKIKNCRFIDCQLDNKDGKLCFCTYSEPISRLKIADIDNLDYDTCDFCNITNTRSDIDANEEDI